MDFDSEIARETPAPVILERAIALMEEEMASPEGFLSPAMVEYAACTEKDVMASFMAVNEKKWTALLRCGIRRGEFRPVRVEELVPIILYTYQGIRLWSPVIPMERSAFRAVLSHIRHQLIKE